MWRAAPAGSSREVPLQQHDGNDRERRRIVGCTRGAGRRRGGRARAPPASPARCRSGQLQSSARTSRSTSERPPIAMRMRSLRAPAHQVREHAVDTDGRQRQGQHREHAHSPPVRRGVARAAATTSLIGRTAATGSVASSSRTAARTGAASAASGPALLTTSVMVRGACPRRGGTAWRP